MAQQKLQRLTIHPQSPSSQLPFEVQFNPNSLSISKPVTWIQQADTAGTDDRRHTNRELDAPPMTFGGGGARVLTLQLFCDVTESGPDADVRDFTNRLVALTRIEPGLGRPPSIEISWGGAPPKDSDLPFVGVVSNLQQTFVLFSSAGAPQRANVTLTCTEFNDAEKNLRHVDPDLTTYTVKRADTLSAIAARMYRDPSLWRLIADANDIDDPRTLVVGARLAIPEKP